MVKHCLSSTIEEFNMFSTTYIILQVLRGFVAINGLVQLMFILACKTLGVPFELIPNDPLLVVSILLFVYLYTVRLN